MIDLLIPDWPAPSGIRAISTTRWGGSSEFPYDSLNLADHVGDQISAVTDNRRRLHGALPELSAEPLWLKQIHGARCISADKAVGRHEADASVARSRNIVCAILTADCLPVLFCDEKGSVVAAAHAGWRGLVRGILEATIVACRCPPEQLLAWMGPAIGPQAFEVGNDVRDPFVASNPRSASAFSPHAKGKWLCDLYMLARMRLADAGVKRIYGGTHCTFNEPERFFSFRRDGRTGRMATLIWRL